MATAKACLGGLDSGKLTATSTVAEATMLIGLTGLAGSGKSAVADRLSSAHGYRRIAFADPLKTMLAAVGFTQEQLYGEEKLTVIPELKTTPRHVMQTLGTEWGRDLIHPDIWVILWGRTTDLARYVDQTPVVVEDVRFPNEVRAIRRRGGVIVHVDRPGVQAMGHPSEAQQLEPADFVLLNKGSLAELDHTTDAVRGLAAWTVAHRAG